MKKVCVKCCWSWHLPAVQGCLLAEGSKTVAGNVQCTHLTDQEKTISRIFSVFFSQFWVFFSPELCSFLKALIEFHFAAGFFLSGSSISCQKFKKLYDYHFSYKTQISGKGFLRKVRRKKFNFFIWPFSTWTVVEKTSSKSIDKRNQIFVTSNATREI